jgi:hypothetical protein
MNLTFYLDSISIKRFKVDTDIKTAGESFQPLDRLAVLQPVQIKKLPPQWKKL